MAQAQIDEEARPHVDGHAGDPLLAVVEDAAELAADVLRLLQVGQHTRNGPLGHARVFGQPALAVQTELAFFVEVAQHHGGHVKAGQHRPHHARQGVPALLVGPAAGHVDIIETAQVLGLALVGLFLHAVLRLGQQPVKR
ncbi:hypothetical protein D3C76_365320 [compost metagenome]